MLLPLLACTRYWLLVYTPPNQQLFLSGKLRLRTFVALRANSHALTQDFPNGPRFLAQLIVDPVLPSTSSLRVPLAT